MVPEINLIDTATFDDRETPPVACTNRGYGDKVAITEFGYIHPHQVVFLVIRSGDWQKVKKQEHSSAVTLHELPVLARELRLESLFRLRQFDFGSHSELKDVEAFWTAQTSTFCASRRQMEFKLFELHDLT